MAVYRPDLLERAGVEVPRRWDETLEAAGALRGNGLWAVVPAIPVDAICAFLDGCVALGEEPFATDGVVARATGRAALHALESLVARAHPSSLEWNPPRMMEHMSEADDVAYCPLAFGYSNYARPGFRTHPLRFAPAPAGPEGVPRGTLGGAGLAVSAHCQAVDDAVGYAAFVAGAGAQRGVYFDGGGQPGHRSAWTDPGVNAASGGFFLDTLGALDAAYLRPRYEGFLGFQESAGALVHAHIRDPQDAERTLDRLDDAYRASLARQRV